MAEGLGFWAFHCHGLGSASDWRTEILQAMRYGGEKKTKTDKGDTEW